MDTSALRSVPETRFGPWFLKTGTWGLHVLQRAMNGLERLPPAARLVNAAPRQPGTPR